jgi:hypothetical protein
MPLPMPEMSVRLQLLYGNRADGQTDTHGFNEIDREKLSKAAEPVQIGADVS